MENKMNVEFLNTLDDSKNIELERGLIGTAILVAGGLVFLSRSTRRYDEKSRYN